MNKHDAKTLAIRLQGLTSRNSCGLYRHRLRQFGLCWLLVATDLRDIAQTTRVLTGSTYVNMAWWNGMFDWLRERGMY
jgi:hypothetical protein